MNIDFIELIKQAFQMTWKYKILWLFGLLIGFTLVGSNGGSNGNNQRQDQASNLGYGPSSTAELEKAQEQIISFFSNPASWLILALVIVLIIVIAVIFWYVRVNSEIALFRAVAYDKSNQPEKIGFRSLWSEGGSKTFKIMLFEFLSGIVLFLVTLPLWLPAAVIPFIICCTFIPLIIIGLGYFVAQIAIKNLFINHNYSLMDAVKAGLNLVKNNFVNSIVFILTYIVFGIILVILFILFMILMAIPLFAITLFIISLGNLFLQIVLVITVVLILSLIFGLIKSPLTTFFNLYNILFVVKLEEMRSGMQVR